eukprot:CAMPEP_0202446068 /NCGR_PEP_ID=MMETSP1360-20130828/4705_1 /ASSEMBLY_ACC=CAM_ASM_000848 /TAXON_ID=515479 /ORGANISM="Licmophora paradoxa, Strain CCMP2313" /LENGTH=209 /DNA_ID=CAMNT_0049062487 /DNA_START=402 /DNA_END=1031 /DNA_ORIENTATION=+
MNELQCFGDALIRGHIVSLTLRSLPEHIFRNSHKIRRSAVYSIHDGAAFPFHPGISRSTRAPVIFLNITVPGGTESKIFGSCQVKYMVDFHGTQKIGYLEGPRSAADGPERHVQNGRRSPLLAVFVEQAGVGVAESALAAEGGDFGQPDFGWHGRKMCLPCGDPVGLTKIIGPPHEMAGRFAWVVDQIGAAGEVFVDLVELAGSIHVEI